MSYNSKTIEKSPWPTGSIWRRWDLHVHTPESILGDSFHGISWSDYVDALEESSNRHKIAVMGVTDYMTMDGYEKLIEEKNKHSRLQSIDLLIPNIEFRILPATTNRTALNVHLLIDPSESDHVQRIKDALKNLRFTYSGQTYGCVYDELIKFGKAQDSRLCDRGAYKLGIEQFKPERTEIINWLSSERWLRNNSLLGITNGKDGISGLPLKGGFSAIRDEILKACNFIFSGIQADRELYLGQKDGIPPEKIIRQSGSLKPCLHGSDAHEINDLFKPDEDKFCWIKSDPTFHGLRQVLWEPEHRVHIGEIPPQHSDKSQVISQITISNDKNWFETKEVNLNPALVAIIGEKGSGKTAIAEMIAFASGVPLDKPSQSSFINKGIDHLQDVKVQLYWGNKKSTSAVLSDSPLDVEYPKVRYLSQDFVERISSHDYQGLKLQNAIEEVVFGKLDEIQKEGYSSFGELRKALESASQSRRGQLRGELASIHSEVERHIKNVEERPSKVALKKDTEQKLNELPKQIPSTSNTLDGQILKELKVAREKKEMAEGQVSKLKRDKRAIETILEKYKEIQKSTADEIKQMAKRLESLSIGIGQEMESKMHAKWDDQVVEILQNQILSHGVKIGEITGSSDSSPKESLAELKETIQHLEKKLEGDKVTNKRILDIQKKISSAKTTIERLKFEIEKIDVEDKGMLCELHERQLSLYLEIFKSLGEDEKGLTELYSPFQDAINSLGEDMQFKISVGYQIDMGKWLDKFNSFFDNRRAGIEKKKREISKIVELKVGPAWKSGDVDQIKDAMEQLLSVLKVDLFPSEYGIGSLSHSEIYDWVFSSEHISLGYKIRYGETELEHLSPGARGIALLVLYLLMDEDDTRPLLIDQPEGNLDNSSVFEQLVPYIKKAKMRRQVILITHNPNLVVATDAEQIIVASAKRLRAQPYPVIDYISGSLEHSVQSQNSMGIREAVCLFLEGGKDAFQVRENKYELEKGQPTASGV